MPRVVHFEIQADDPKRARAFYAGLFGWEFNAWGGPQEYWLIKTGPESTRGADGGLLRRHGPTPVEGQSVNAFVCTIEVPAIDEYIQKIGTLSGVICVPKMPIPGVGWLAYAKDTDGNIFGVMQPDPAAK